MQVQRQVCCSWCPCSKSLGHSTDKTGHWMYGPSAAGEPPPPLPSRRTLKRGWLQCASLTALLLNAVRSEASSVGAAANPP